MLRDRSIVCIDFDERSLRIVDASHSRSSVRIRKAVYVPLGEGVNPRDPGSLGEFLKRALAEHRIRTRRAIVDVPRQDAVFNLISLPKGSLEEMTMMVHVQAGKELPFPKDQAVVDFALAGGEGAGGGGMCDVWLAAIRIAVVDRYRQVITGAGLKLERIGLRPYANLAALTPEQVAEGRTLMVDVGAAMTEINVIQQGRLVYSRAASVSIPPGGLSEKGGRPASEEAGASSDEGFARPAPMEALIIEVNRTVQAYRASDPGATIDRIVLAGTEGIDARVAARFEEQFGAPATIYEPPPGLRWRREKGVSAAPFSAAIGLAQGSISQEMQFFDFIHPKEPEAAQRVRRRKRPLVVVTAALFVAAAGVLAYNPIRERKAEIAALEARKKYENTDREARQQLEKLVKDVDGWQSQNLVWIDRLNALSEVFPSNKEAYITRLECSEKGEARIELATKNDKVGTRLIEALTAMRDKDKKLVWGGALPGRGNASTVSEYPFKDQVTVLIGQKPAPAKKK
ncbi:MAG: pilus assembly protein PilM [Phycisphaerae bacterium]|nr:pilus assembly protein PilM [Phycisphaerae bacterium]